MKDIIKGLFGNKSEPRNESKINWVNLDSSDNFLGIIDQSELNTIILFKHSPRCGISSSVLRKFEKQLNNLEKDHMTCYILNVIQNRNVSNEISRYFSIQHESPQLLVLKQRKVLAYGSHYEILSMDLSVL